MWVLGCEHRLNSKMSILGKRGPRIGVVLGFYLFCQLWSVGSVCLVIDLRRILRLHLGVGKYFVMDVGRQTDGMCVQVCNQRELNAELRATDLKFFKSLLINRYKSFNGAEFTNVIFRLMWPTSVEKWCVRNRDTSWQAYQYAQKCSCCVFSAHYW